MNNDPKKPYSFRDKKIDDYTIYKDPKAPEELSLYARLDTPDAFVAEYHSKDSPTFEAAILKRGKITTNLPGSAPGSRWNIHALLALRIVPSFNHEVEELIPGYKASAKDHNHGAQHEMLVKLRQVRALDLGIAALPNLTLGDKRLKNLMRLVELEKEGKVLQKEDIAEDVLELRPLQKFLDNPFINVFTAIRDRRARLLAEKFEDTKYTIDNSTEAAENTLERGSEEILHRLMETILLYFAQQTGDSDWFRSTANPLTIKLGLQRVTEVIVLPKATKKKSKKSSKKPENKPDDESGNESDPQFDVPADAFPCKVIDDGYLYLSRSGKWSGSNRYSKIPIVRYEAKAFEGSLYDEIAVPEGQLNAEPGMEVEDKKDGGEPEDGAPSAETMATSKKVDPTPSKRPSAVLYNVTAQLAAEMLTGMLANRRYAYEREKTRLKIKTLLAKREAKKSPAEQTAERKQNKVQTFAVERLKGDKNRFDAIDNKALDTEKAADERLIKLGGHSPSPWLRRASSEHILEEETKDGVTTNADGSVLVKRSSEVFDITDEMFDIIDEKPIEKHMRDDKHRPRPGTNNPDIDLSELELTEIDEAELQRLQRQHYRQEMFIIHIRHLSVSIAHMEASGEYLDLVGPTSKELRLKKKHPMCELRRTKEFNLLYCDQRVEAGKMIWALLKYLHSGSTKIGRLQVVHMDGTDIGISLPIVPALFSPNGHGTHEQPGMVSIGASYFSATLQALAASILSHDNFQTLSGMSERVANGQNGVVLAAFVEVVEVLHSGGNKPIYPQHLADALYSFSELERANKDETMGAANVPWNMFEEQDSGKFLDRMLRAFTIADVDVMKLFNGVEQFNYACECVEWIMGPITPFSRVHLPVPRGAEATSVQELMPGRFGDKRVCGKDGCARLMNTGSTVSKYPPILVVHLDRYAAPPAAMQNALEEIQADTGERILPGVGRKNERPVSLFCGDEPAVDFAGRDYKLFAAICHNGKSVNTGIHVSYVRRQIRQGMYQWYMCYDDVVRDVEEHELMELEAVKVRYQVQEHDQSVDKWYWDERQNATPYLLFYCLNPLQPNAVDDDNMFA